MEMHMPGSREMQGKTHMDEGHFEKKKRKYQSASERIIRSYVVAKPVEQQAQSAKPSSPPSSTLEVEFKSR
jgi:hypothetical protein